MRSLFMRLILLVASAFVYAAPLLSQPPHREASPLSVDGWVKAVNAQLDAAIVMPDGSNGIATVTFRRGANGRATDVHVAAKSEQLKRAAFETIRKLDRLPQMPPGVDMQQAVKAQLLFADDDGVAYQRARQTMLAGAQVINRQFARNIVLPAVELAAVR